MDRVSRSDTRIVLVDRVSRFDTRIVVVDRVSRSDTRIVVVDRVSRSDTRIVGDRSVTFWHQDGKENESWIMLIYSDLMNLIPKWVWYGGLSPHRCAWVVANGYGTCCCYLLSMVVDFMLLSDIYCFLFWVDRWYLLSTRVLYWPLLVIVFFVICGVQQTCHRLQLNRNSSKSSSRQISGWAIVSSLDWILSFTSWCLEVLEWTSSLVILAS